VFRRDLVGEKLEILSPLIGSQSGKRSFTMSKVGSKEQQEAEQFLHKARQVERHVFDSAVRTSRFG
jgi:hypothetical protein